MILAALCYGGVVHAAECNSELSLEEKMAQFKRLDAAGERAVAERRPSDAVQLYEQAVCLAPNSARGFYGLGMAEAAAGEFARAREAFRTSDRLQPRTGMPPLMEVRVNFSLDDINALKANLREAAARFPRDALLHAAMARFLAEHNLFVLALAEAMHSQASLDDANVTLQLAVLENTVGAYDDAVREALAVKLRTDATNEMRGAAAGIAGLSYESLHQPEQGLRYLREAVELDPLQENSYLALADLLEQMQKYGEAVIALEKGRSRLPKSRAVSLALGADLVRSERYEEGVKVLRGLLQEAPETAEAYVSLAEAARNMGNITDELAALRGLERIQPDYPMLSILIARCILSDKGSIDIALVLNELGRAAMRNPADAEVYLLQGKAYAASGQYKEAVSALERSIELRPMETSAYYQLARLYQKLGNLEMARKEFDRVRNLEETSKP